jgi:thioredoxin-related protein
VDFTGSDWCAFCMKLKREVLNSDFFTKKASQKFVFVELDYPNKPIPEDLKAQNEILKQQYKIGGFPTICVMDSEGRLIARLVGYHRGGPEKYVAVLGGLCKTWESVWKLRDELADANGMERTKLLDRLTEACEKLDDPMDYF